MNNQAIAYGAIGLVSGIFLTFLLGFLGMGSMMWGRGGMMDRWGWGNCENYNYRQSNPNNPSQP